MAIINAVGYHEITLTIEVAGGAGSVDFQVSVVRIDTIAFDIPGSLSFDYEIVDRNNRGVTGKTGLTGDNTLVVDRLCLGQNTLKISNALTDGTYLATLRMRSYT